MVNETAPSLARQSVIAFMWGTGGGIIRIVLQLGTQVALARILGPDAYGLFALGVLIVGVSTYFADFGLAYGLIQKQRLTDDDVRFVWTWQCVLGCLVATTIWLLAGWLAGLFGKPEVEPVFAWLSVICLVNAMSATSTNLLKKALDYKGLQLAQLLGYALGYIAIGIPLALAGAGVYALVAAMLTQATVSLVILYGRAQHPVAPRFLVPGGRSMLAYGGTVLATNLVNWVFTNADKILVGRMFPAHVVGLYSTAFNLVNSPASAAYGNLQSVVFSACARLQADPAAMRDVFRRLVAGVLVTAFPLFAVVGAGAGIAIDAVYGPTWADATPYLRVFAFAMPCLLLWGVSTPILWNAGRTTLEFQLQLPLAIVWCGVLWLVSGQPGVTVALAAAGLLGIRAVGMTLVAARILQLPVRDVVFAVRGGAAFTICLGLVSWYVLAPLASLFTNAQLQMLVLLLCGAIAFVGMLVVFGPWLIDRPLAATVRHASAQLPRFVAWPIRVATRGGASA